MQYNYKMEHHKRRWRINVDVYINEQIPCHAISFWAFSVSGVRWAGFTPWLTLLTAHLTCGGQVRLSSTSSLRLSVQGQQLVFWSAVYCSTRGVTDLLSRYCGSCLADTRCSFLALKFLNIYNF